MGDTVAGEQQAPLDFGPEPEPRRPVTHRPLVQSRVIYLGAKPLRVPWRVWHGMTPVCLLMPRPITRILAPIPRIQTPCQAYRSFRTDREGRWPNGYSRTATFHFPTFGVSATGDIVQYVDPLLRAVPLDVYCTPLEERPERIIILPMTPPGPLRGMPTEQQCAVVKGLAAWLAEQLRVPSDRVDVDPMYDAPGGAIRYKESFEKVAHAPIEYRDGTTEKAAKKTTAERRAERARNRARHNEEMRKQELGRVGLAPAVDEVGQDHQKQAGQEQADHGPSPASTRTTSSHA